MNLCSRNAWLVMLVVLLTACASMPPPDLPQTISPGIEARIPAWLTRIEGLRGIDSDVARFEGRGSVLIFDRGMHIAHGSTWVPLVASPVIATGQTLDRSAIIEGGDHLYAITLVERVAFEASKVGEPPPQKMRLSIRISCEAPSRCEAIADDIQASLSISEPFPAVP